MNASALAATPIFTISLVLCGLLTIYGFAVLLKSLLNRTIRATATSGLMSDEVRSLEFLSNFHNQLEALIDKVVTLENLSSEVPEPFQESSWQRLLDLCDNLHMVRGKMHSLLQVRDFSSAASLGAFLSGRSNSIPQPLQSAPSFPLRELANWHEESKNHLQRLIARLEDITSGRERGLARDVSPDFHQIVQHVKADLAHESNESHSRGATRTK